MSEATHQIDNRQVASIKAKLYRILEEMPAGDKVGQIVNSILLTVIFLNTVASIIQTVNSISTLYGRFFYWFELISVILFSIEYLIRMWICTEHPHFRAAMTGRLRHAILPLSLIDLLAILPFYLPMFFPFDLRFLRILRLLRIFRVLKLARYSESFQLLGRVIRRRAEELLVTLFTIIIILVLSSSIMYFVEHDISPNAFPDIPSALWWGVVTMTTIGYGDLFPISPLGKVIGSIVALLGIGLFALPAGILASGFVEEIQKRREQVPTCPHCGKRLDGEEPSQ